MEKSRPDSSEHVTSDEDSYSESKKYPDYCRTIQVKDSNGLVKELVFPKALDLDRPKRARTTFSQEQLSILEHEFLRNQYLVGRERSQLAKRLGLSETQVKVWFQNRRTKYKRDREREAEMRDSEAETVATQNILRLLGSSSSCTPTLTPPLPPTPTLLSSTFPFYSPYVAHRT